MAILMMLILPIHEHGTCFHFFVSSFISFFLLVHTKRNTPRHVIITLAKIKDKERILEAVREQDTVTSKGVPVKLSADFSKETLQARKRNK